MNETGSSSSSSSSKSTMEEGGEEVLRLELVGLFMPHTCKTPRPHTRTPTSTHNHTRPPTRTHNDTRPLTRTRTRPHTHRAVDATEEAATGAAVEKGVAAVMERSRKSQRQIPNISGTQRRCVCVCTHTQAWLWTWDKLHRYECLWGASKQGWT